MQVFYDCQRCGNCCRWPGQVKLTQDDIRRMAHLLELSEYSFTETYTELHSSRKYLILKNKLNHACIFLHGINECRVQDAKPLQCQGFPNQWNFPGWRKVCEAEEVILEDHS